MKFIIRHEIKGRIRIHIMQKSMSYREADTLYYYLEKQSNIVSAVVRTRTCDATICYTGNREDVIKLLLDFTYQTADVSESYLENSGRQLNEEYWEKLVGKILWRMARRVFAPYPLRKGITMVKSAKYMWHGAKILRKGKIEVPVLDATAIGVSMLRGDYKTASYVMFIL